MLDLTQSLHSQDMAYLQIVANLWGVPIEAMDARADLQQIVAAVQEPGRLADMVVSLPPEGRAALDDLLRNDGRLPWSLFTLRHGELREMGAGRRDRERPHLNPISATEILWYRALVCRAFLDVTEGPQEYAYLPAEFKALLPVPEALPGEKLGRPAKAGERSIISPVNDRILDHACTLLAALRLGFPDQRLAEISAAWQPAGVATAYLMTANALAGLLEAAGLVDASAMPVPDATRHFLELPRGKALAQLVRSWNHSPSYNELRLIPDLFFEGEWQNDPLRARYAILDFLATVPPDIWWNLKAFVSDIQKKHPNYQRPAGDYDSWYIRSQTSNKYLRGFEHWDDVDGALIRFMILGPLHWLGILDLAAPAPDAAPLAFRLSPWAEALLNGAPPENLEKEDETFLISSDARIRVPRLVPRAARYQLARFSEWESESAEAYLYRLTPASLERARGQGLRVIHLLTLLRRYALAVPPSLEKALTRWQDNGTEAHLENLLVLRLRNPEMLQMLRSSRAARFLEEPLGPTAVIIKPGAWEKVLAILAEMGYLGEAPQE
jgi:hypothetical protein